MLTAEQTQEAEEQKRRLSGILFQTERYLFGAGNVGSDALSCDGALVIFTSLQRPPIFPRMRRHGLVRARNDLLRTGT